MTIGEGSRRILSGLALAGMGLVAACSIPAAVVQTDVAASATQATVAPQPAPELLAEQPAEQATTEADTQAPEAAPTAVPEASEPIDEEASEPTSPRSELAMRIDSLPLGDDVRPVFPLSVHAGVSFDDPWSELADEFGNFDSVTMEPVPDPGDDLDEWCVRGVYEGQPMPGYFARTEWGQLTDDGDYLTIWLWTETYTVAAEAENARGRRFARNEHCTDIPVVKRFGGNGISPETSETTVHQTPSGLDARFKDTRSRDEGYLTFSIDAGLSVTHIRISGIPDDQVTEMLPLMDLAATQVVGALKAIVTA